MKRRRLNIGSVILFLHSILLRFAVAYECHREGKFVKVKPDGLPQINPIKVTTATEKSFCSIECMDHSGCNSFVYLNYTSSNNCLLSNSAEGETVSDSTNGVEIYKKAVLAVAKGCEPNPCQNGGTCLHTCQEPFYHCICPEPTIGKQCLNPYVPFNAKFTNLGASGNNGPTTIGNYYNGQDHENMVTLVGGIQHFTVPYTGTYKITAVGAAGGFDKSGSTYRGKGARLGGNFNLQQGQVLKILVGQAGLPNSAHYSSGGGGGSFVVTSSDTPLIVAGGGGGVEKPSKLHPAAHASLSTTGKGNGGASQTKWNGGTDGFGATEADSSNSGGGGGGFYGNGRSSKKFGGNKGTGGEGGRGFLQGGVGGRPLYNNAYGGFGGGGGSYGNAGGAGGGGGYSGGASGDNSYDSCGGGGGSYNSAHGGSFQSSGYNNGHGYVTVERVEA